jgi:hypothetical protein
MYARDQRQHRISRRSLMPLRRITWSVRKYTDGSGKGAAINSFGLALAENGLPERWTISVCNDIDPSPRPSLDVAEPSKSCHPGSATTSTVAHVVQLH